VAWVFILVGALVSLGGLWLWRRHSPVATYRGVGGFRLTSVGVACYLGQVMMFVGLVFVAAGILFLL
jgi:hypothetical protein